MLPPHRDNHLNIPLLPLPAAPSAPFPSWLQGCIVRIMKARKALTFAALVAQVVSDLEPRAFRPDVKMIKQRVRGNGRPRPVPLPQGLRKPHSPVIVTAFPSSCLPFTFSVGRAPDR